MSATKFDLMIMIAKKHGFDHDDTRVIVQAFLDEIEKELPTNGRLEIRNFGIFRARIRKPRTIKHPSTKVEYRIESKAAITFRPSKHMDAKVNGKE